MGHPALETLEFTGDGRCRNPLRVGLVDLVKHSKSLRKLHITGADIDDDCLLAIAEVGSHLQRIDLFDSAPVSQGALNAFRRQNPQCAVFSDPSSYCALKGETVFDFGGAREVGFDQDEIDDLVARGAATVPRMVIFNPRDGRVSDLGLSYLRASHTLRSAHLQRCPDVTVRGLEFLGECPNLESVTLAAEGSKISDEDVRAFHERFPGVKVVRR